MGTTSSYPNSGAPQAGDELLGVRSGNTVNIETVDLYVTILSDLQAVDTTANVRTAYMIGRTSVGDGGEGHFRWDSSDRSTEVAADPGEAVYVPPDTDTSGTSGSWVRQYNGAIRPEWAGAVGDGTTIDTDAFVNIAENFSGAVIEGRPGAIYLIDAAISPSAGQKWLGNGATIKRANQVTATTQESITTGSSPTTITVDDASGFRVGSYVTVTQSGSTDTAVHKIAAISGNDVTVNTVFTTSFTSGATMLSAYIIFGNASDDVEISEWELNGNRANYQDAGLRWETHAEIRTSGNRCIVRDNYIHDTPVEAVLFGGDGTIIDNNYIKDIGGNGIHYSGTSNYTVSNNYVENTQQWSTEDPGHQDGCISLSNLIQDGYTVYNYFKNGESGFGAIDSSGNSRNTFAYNTVINCTSAWDMLTFSNPAEWTRIEHNNFFDCGPGIISSTKTAPADDSEKYTRVFIVGTCSTTRLFRTAGDATSLSRGITFTLTTLMLM